MKKLFLIILMASSMGVTMAQEAKSHGDTIKIVNDEKDKVEFYVDGTKVPESFAKAIDSNSIQSVEVFKEKNQIHIKMKKSALLKEDEEVTALDKSGH